MIESNKTAIGCDLPVIFDIKEQQLSQELFTEDAQQSIQLQTQQQHLHLRGQHLHPQQQIQSFKQGYQSTIYNTKKSNSLSLKKRRLQMLNQTNILYSSPQSQFQNQIQKQHKESPLFQQKKHLRKNRLTPGSELPVTCEEQSWDYILDQMGLKEDVINQLNMTTPLQTAQGRNYTQNSFPAGISIQREEEQKRRKKAKNSGEEIQVINSLVDHLDLQKEINTINQIKVQQKVIPPKATPRIKFLTLYRDHRKRMQEINYTYADVIRQNLDQIRPLSTFHGKEINNNTSSKASITCQQQQGKTQKNSRSNLQGVVNNSNSNAGLANSRVESTNKINSSTTNNNMIIANANIQRQGQQNIINKSGNLYHNQQQMINILNKPQQQQQQTPRQLNEQPQKQQKSQFHSKMENQIKDLECNFYMEAYIKRENYLRFQLKEQDLRINVLDRALLRKFLIDDLKDQQMEIYTQMKKQIPKFNLKSYRENKEDLKRWLTKMKAQQMRLYLNSEQYKNCLQDEDYTDEGKLKKMQTELINKHRKCSAAEMTQQILDEDVETQQNKNQELIEYLIHYNPREQINDQEIQNQKRVDEIIMRRCFFYSSNQDDPDLNLRYLEVHREKFSDYINEICGDVVTEEVVQNVYNKLTRAKQKQIMNFYDFFEAVRRIAIQFFQNSLENSNGFIPKAQPNNNQDQYQDEKNPLNPNINQQEELAQIGGGTNENILSRFVHEVVIKHMDKYLIQEDKEIRQCLQIIDVREYINTFLPAIKEIFIFAGNVRTQRVIEYQLLFLTFQDAFEIIWQLGFFPSKISKSVIRQLYYYCLNQDQGLNLDEFCTFMHLIGLTLMRRPQKVIMSFINPEQQIQQQQAERKIPPQLHYVINHIKLYNPDCNKTVEQVILDLGRFYLNSQFIDSPNIQHRLKRIRDTFERTKKL